VGESDPCHRDCFHASGHSLRINGT